MDTFSSDDASSVGKILKGKGGRMVVQIDNGREGNGAIEPESDKPRQHYHSISIIYTTI